MTHRIEVYKDRTGEWRWRIRARNGQIVATGGEGYVSLRKLDESLGNIIKAFLDDTCDGSQIRDALAAMEGEQAGTPEPPAEPEEPATTETETETAEEPEAGGDA